MLRRRLIQHAAIAVVALTLPFSAPSLAQSIIPNDPVAIVNAVYARVAAGKGDGGGGFIAENKAAKAKYLSKALIALWATAGAHTPHGDVGPLDFDPVTNSQDPDVKSFTVTSEKADSGMATIAVTITGSQAARANAADNVIRYDFVRDGGHWKIDDIRGAIDGKPWSVRDILTASLKT